MLSYIFLVELFFSCWVIFSHWLFHEAALCFMFQVRHLIFFLWHSLYCTVLMWILWSKELNFLHFCHVIFGDFSMQKSHKYIHIIHLTAVAWVSGPNLAPQKMKLCQKFRHLMRCKKYFENFFLSCLVSEIQLFVYISYSIFIPPLSSLSWTVKS